ncbi:MAG: hypothetical protein ACYDA5_06815 [Vulcanimicrobiaceae bacterium]
MQRAFLVAAACVVALLVACSGGATSRSGSARSSPSPSPMPTNPTGVALYPGSRILVSQRWSQTVSSAQAGRTGLFAAGAGTYHGRQVIAATQASLGELRRWIRTLSAQPPAGYTTLATGSGVDEARRQAERFGIDVAAFTRQRRRDGATVGLLVLAVDPHRVTRKLGLALGLMEKFESLPASLRAPVDDQVRAQFGFTATAALAPGAPLGSALAAVRLLRTGSERAVVIIDATKQRSTKQR